MAAFTHKGRGVRFAPSPTGTFHLGNLRTAWISYEWARALGEPWVLRFEDIDRPRVAPGAMERQLRDMAALGLQADQVLVQSEFEARHWTLFERARESGQAYPCFCSRKEILQALHESASAPHVEPALYHGRCRDLTEAQRGEALAGTTHPSIAWRFRNSDPQGGQDFIIARTGRDLRSEFVPSYQWACAIDDYDGGYPLLVRAWDLEHAVTQQRAVHAWLCQLEERRPFPAVFHTALVTLDSGGRLEKRTRGVTLEELAKMKLPAEAVMGRFRGHLLQRLSSGEGLPWVGGTAFQPERVWGETLKTVTLSELGFSSIGA